jgi:adenine-specific DNA-methyltransferase
MKLYTTLEQQLKQEPNFVTDNGELKKWVVLNKAQNFDEELIGLLLDNADLREKFFIKVKGSLVFNQNLFVQFLEQKNYLNDSYTQYKNKVGLTIDGKYLQQRNEVALVWPFKDCVLEGGKSREEDKREEIFFNEILAQDEITQLLDPKVLTNVKRIDKDGEKPLDQFNRNENGTITDNLIIKGNNLLVLRMLKEEFTGKVKLIYIDPPYNRDADSFYNDTFKRSTWLTFMRNRLEAAKELLANDGLIFVQIDDNQYSYLKVLMDELFTHNNFVNTIIVKPANPVGLKMRNIDRRIIRTKEYLLVYAKNYDKIKINPLYVQNEDYDHYDIYLEKNNSENPKEWKIRKVKEIIANDEKINTKNVTKEMVKKFTLVNLDNIYCSSFIEDRLDRKEFAAKNPGEITIYKNPDGSIMYMYKKRTLFPLAKKTKIIDGVRVPTEILCDLWVDIKWDGISKEGGVCLPNGKKPETLIMRLIELVTDKGDIVLDYHLGSGSTCAVAHKMDRQYIGVEQLDYGDNDSLKRLKNVINGDSTGISKSVNWLGGGTFVHVELKKYNQTFIDQIKEAKDTSALFQIWEQMKTKSLLNYNVDIKKQDEHLEEFKALSLVEQKQHLCELLDKNQLYVNLSSLNDTDFACTEEEKKVTKDFYQIGK